MPKTVGISPKVYVPALAQIALGAGLLIAGLPDEGKILVGAGLGTLGIGYTAKPGTVENASGDMTPADR